MIFTRGRITTVLFVVIVLLLVLIAPSIFIRDSISDFLFTKTSDIKFSDVVLIPGASVVRGAPSAILRSRSDAAVALYQGARASNILVSGDNGAKEYDEVTPVVAYLIDSGIPKKDIIVDRGGFDTFTSLFRARETLGFRSIVIVTQDFHVARAVFIARALGLDARGFATPGGRFFDYVRELPASWKAVLDIGFNRTPSTEGDLPIFTKNPSTRTE